MRRGDRRVGDQLDGTGPVAAAAVTLRNDPRHDFDSAPMNHVRIAAVAVTVALSALDGYDVLSITFAAPAIALEWGIGKAALGGLLSAGLAGMALGSLVIAPFADLVGRRRLVLGSLALMAAGMLLSATARSVPQLIAWRVLTGLGIGTMVAVINPIAAEFANARCRPLSLALMAMGYPAGGLVGGLASVLLLEAFGWPAVFLAGAAAACLMVPLVLLLVPEPLAFLIARGGVDGLVRVNALMRRCGLDTAAELPAAAENGPAGYAAVFAPGRRKTTVRLTVANLLFVVTVYYVLSWLPLMVADAGFTPSDASRVAATASLAGIAGGVTLGWLARRTRLTSLTGSAMAGTGVATAIFGITPASLPLLMCAAGACGFFLFASIAGLYATLAAGFTSEGRASGTGFVIGVGRLGSAAAPLLAGWLFGSGLGGGSVSLAFGASAAIAGMVLAFEPTASRLPVPSVRTAVA